MYTKDLDISSDSEVVSHEDFQTVLDYARWKIADLADALMEGRIAPNPYRHKQESSCERCEFASLCPFDQAAGSYREIPKLKNEEALAEMRGDGIHHRAAEGLITRKKVQSIACGADAAAGSQRESVRMARQFGPLQQVRGKLGIHHGQLGEIHEKGVRLFRLGKRQGPVHAGIGEFRGMLTRPLIRLRGRGETSRGTQLVRVGLQTAPSLLPTIFFSEFLHRRPGRVTATELPCSGEYAHPQSPPRGTSPQLPECVHALSLRNVLLFRPFCCQ